MTPYEINVLLHYYCRTEDHPDMERNPPVWRPTIDAFKEAGVLKETGANHKAFMCYELTDRGRAYVDALRQVPLPDSTWIVKWPNSESR